MLISIWGLVYALEDCYNLVAAGCAGDPKLSTPTYVVRILVNSAAFQHKPIPFNFPYQSYYGIKVVFDGST